MTNAQHEGARDVLLDELREMLAEPLDHARERERALVAELDSQPHRPIVLFGAGNLGRRTASLLRDRGRPVAAFIDNNRDLWGSFIEEVPVLSLDDASTRYAQDGLALVTIWRAEGGHDFGTTRDDLRKLGWSCVQSFIPLFWGLGGGALPHVTVDIPTKVLQARAEVLAVASLWSDERSLRDYVGQIRWRLTADFGALPSAERHQYFAEGLIAARPDEVFVDCGAYNGDTMLDLARIAGSWERYHAFEPDPGTFAELQQVVESLPSDMPERVHLYRSAVADCRRAASFSATGKSSASLSSSGECQVDCVSLDEVLEGPPATFIKMDVEGAEPDALAGARATICAHKPLLAIAAYHRQADIWKLPIQISAMVPEYSMFLRPHAAEGFEMVLYAIPPERVPYR